ncbi:MAG: hypothetical protein AAF560_27735 [Acidobacteriota bacterium]
MWSSIDGMVGRMMSWWSQPPIRSRSGADPTGARMEAAVETTVTGVEDRVEDAFEAVSGKPGDAVAGDAVAGDAVAGDAVAATPASVVEAVATASNDPKEVAEAAAGASADSETLDARVVGVLGTAGDGLAMRQLVAETGAERYAIRRRLKQLIESGQVQRRGDGMKTRYYLVEAS